MTDVQLFFDGDVTPVNQRSSVYQWDDFRGPGGELNWALNGTGTPTFALNASATKDRSGVGKLQTSAASNDSAYIQMVDYFENICQTLEWVFQMPTALTSHIVRVGGLSSFPSPFSGVAVEYDTGAGDTALSLVKYISGARTVGATLACSAADWIRMNWSKSGAGTGTLAANNLTAATSQSYAVTGLATLTSTNWSAGAFIQTLTTASKFINVDWFLGSTAGMNR